MKMTKKSNTPVTLILALVASIPIVLAAQNAPIQSGMGSDDTGAPKLALGDPLPGEKLIDKLKLDAKTQAPEVRLLMMDASREAAAIGQQLPELRHRLSNLERQKKPDEIATAVEAYTRAPAESTLFPAPTLFR